MSHSQRYRFSSDHPGLYRTHVVHDGLAIEAGCGIGHNNFNQSVGANDFFIVFYSPICSHLTTSTRLSGLYVNNSASLSTAPAALDLAKITTDSLSMVDCYGGDMISIAQDGFIWSSEMRLSWVGA